MWKAGTKLRRFVIVAVVVTLLGSAWLYWNREPRYRGMPASDYVLQRIGPTTLPGSPPSEGIREMGPELAVPALIRLIQVQDSKLANWYRLLYLQIPPNIRKPLPAPHERDRITAAALLSLAQFGAEASPSVPTLIRVYGWNPSRVTSALSAIGPRASNAVPTLLLGLHPTNTFCFPTASALWQIDPSGDLTAAEFTKNPANIFLQKAVRDWGLQQLNSPSRFGGTSSHWAALQLLGCVRSEAKQTAPIVAGFLHDGNERIRAKAAEALGRFGPVVQEYAEAIRPLLSDDWRMVREAATNALVAIESKRP